MLSRACHLSKRCSPSSAVQLDHRVNVAVTYPGQARSSKVELQIRFTSPKHADTCTWRSRLLYLFLSFFLIIFGGIQVDTQYLRGPHITEVDREGLETAVLGLEFRLRTKHFKRGDLKIKCLATIATVYWKSNELSIEGERPLKMPVMESRETRAQGHTHAEHILGGKQ